jgi:hypothetical protein
MVNNEISETESRSYFNRVTPLSKYLALTLFIAMPFIGGWVGYTYVPEKVIEVETILVREVVTTSEPQTSDYTFEEFSLKGKGPYGHTFLSKEQNLYYIAYEPMGIHMSIEKIPIKDIDSVEFVSDSYIKDNSDVYYLGAIAVETVSGEEMKLSADPKTFRVFLADPNNAKSELGIDQNHVYHKNIRLEGIDAAEMQIVPVEGYSLQIVRDSDTVWLPTGTCSFGGYTLGELEEIESYEPAC